MQLAQESATGIPSGYIVDWSYTDPVTGTKGRVEITRNFWTPRELDTFGTDITSPPEPPTPQTYQIPIYLEPAGQTYTVSAQATHRWSKTVSIEAWLSTSGVKGKLTRPFKSYCGIQMKES